MRAGRRRSINVLAVADAIRAAHPELARPMRWEELRAVLHRERIQLVWAPIRSRAYVDGGGGTFVITVRSGLNSRHHTRVIAHEYAHTKLHFPEHDEVVHQLYPCTPDDPREDEAELLSLLLRIGPDASRSHKRVARLISKLDAPAFTHSSPPQMSLPLPQGTPVLRKAPAPARAKPKKGWWVRFGLGRQPGSAPGLGVSHDAIRLDMSKGGMPLGFFHYDLGWVHVWDRMIASDGDRRHLVTVKCGDRRAVVRDFAISTKDRRRYVFVPKEKRLPTVWKLDEQILRAKRIPIRATSTRSSSREGLTP